MNEPSEKTVNSEQSLAEIAVFFFYDLLFSLGLLFWLPIDLLRCARRGRPRQGVMQRFGVIPQACRTRLSGKKVYWVHAVSVGETRAAKPLLAMLKQRDPDAFLVLTNVTETGHATAQGFSEVDLCLFFPFDVSWVLKRVFDVLSPRALLIVETELWPNLIRVARNRGVPVLLVNGRISDRSFPRYYRFRRLLKPVLKKISVFCMQSSQDARRMEQLGAPATNVLTTGNIKYDLLLERGQIGAQVELRHRFRLPVGVPVLVCGSTHPGEEEQLCRLYRRLQLAGSPLVMVLVPRHPERSASIEPLLQQYGFRSQRISELNQTTRVLTAGDVLLGDTLGDLVALYAAGNMVFIGGSLVPHGGHNVLEACLVRRPAIWGPHMHNFRDISRKVLAAGGGLQVTGLDELYDVVHLLSENPDELERIGNKGHDLLVNNAGATEVTLNQLFDHLPAQR